MSTQTSTATCTNLVEASEAKAFIQRCIEASGADSSHAACLADVVIEADVRGHYSHGLNRLEMYSNEILKGQCDGKMTPVIVKETVATAYVDARNGIGTVAGKFCMELAMKKAKEVGVAWVTCTGSNHFGIAGYYSLMAMKEGLIGIATTNTSPIGVPTRAKKTALGTNPLSFAAPAKDGDSFVLDMATTAVAQGKVEIQHRKGEKIPKGWAVDGEGEITDDPGKMMDDGGLLYLGGGEETGGYKGYSLSMMVEVLGGILGGGPFGKNIRYWKNDSREANLGQTFIALDPGAFAPNFEERMGTFLTEMRNLDPVDPELPVLVAGDPERKHEAATEVNGGIWYHDNLIAAVNALATRLGVATIKVKKTRDK